MVTTRRETPSRSQPKSRKPPSAQTIEIAHLTLRFRSLRIADPVRRGRLASSLAAEGQRTPVVVHREDETYTLIDGYARLEALQALGEDLVSALMLDMGLAAARSDFDVCRGHPMSPGLEGLPS